MRTIRAQHTALLAQQAGISTQLLDQMKTLNGLVRGQGFVGSRRRF